MSDYQHLLHPRSTRVVQQAGFWRRGFAFLLDLLIIDLLIATPFVPLFESLFLRAEYQPLSMLALTQSEFAALLLLGLIIFCYFVLFEYLLGQTIGMSLLKIRLEGETGMIPLMVRNSFLLPVFPFVIFWVIEPFAILLWRRRVLEFLSRTQTIYQRDVLY